MARTLSGLALALAALVFCALPTSAEAHVCSAACGNASRLCGTLARTFYYGCRLDCLATFPADPAGRKACVADCRLVQAADRDVCGVERAECAAECATVADEFCSGEVCGLAYNQCTKSVRAATRACVDAAAGNAAAIQACVEPGDVMQNIGRAALEDCRSNAVTGLDVCLAGC